MSDSAVTTAENPAEGAPDDAPRSTPHVPDRLIHFVLRATLILALLHAYIGWRVLPDLPGGAVVFAAGVAVLALSTLLIPWGMLARFVIARQPLERFQVFLPLRLVLIGAAFAVGTFLHGHVIRVFRV